jgi:oligopeptide/dipeptide ABC transporter ATP-binding protein
MEESILSVKGLKRYFPVTQGILGRIVGYVRAVDGVDFSVSEGRTLAIVGESGSGKTTLARLIVRLDRPTDGQILFEGLDITRMNNRSFLPLRHKIQMVFQDPSSALNPRRKIMSTMLDPLCSRKEITKSEKIERVFRYLEMVGLPAEYALKYPHMLSGGQKQRVVIAKAMISEPELLVLDEPTSSLDVSVQAQIINLLKRLQQSLKVSYIFISHNMSLVRNVAHHVVVMYLGRVMESGPVKDIFERPKHPYTLSLLSSVPTLTPEEDRMLPEKIPLTGETPSIMDFQKGCRFASRCPYVMDICKVREPELVRVENQDVRCHLFNQKIEA